MKLADLKPTPIYDFYWKFAAERQNIFIAKSNGDSFPWTKDEILQKYRFTNVYRACDRVSQFLIKNVIYGSPSKNEEDIVFRILLFKIFNSIETWNFLEQNIGNILYSSFSFDGYNGVLSHMFNSHMKLYSGAYIMPSGKSIFGQDRKFTNHLLLIKHIFNDKFTTKLVKSKSLEDVYKLLLSYPSIGSFLAFQYSIDLNYSEIIDFSEMDYVVAGPGARSGIKKCFLNSDEFTPEEIIYCITDYQSEEFSRLNLQFKNLGKRPLQLIDCQNIFCEFDKYSRVKFPMIKGLFDRNRIKRIYTENDEPIDFFYPPKWQLLL